MTTHVLRSSILWLIVLSLSGCQGEGSGDRSAPAVVLFGAASTTNALNEIKQQFERQSGITVRVSYAASSTLAQQIAGGAEADVLISANARWVDYLEEEGLVCRRRDLLSNRLVVIVPADSRKQIRKPRDLLDPAIEHLALADTAAAPAGIYAKEALSNLGLWERLEQKTVAGADVRQALFYVETGAAEAGIVYATDVAITDSVKVVMEIPAELTEPIRYPLVRLKQGARGEAAEAFYRYLLSPEAAEVFRKHGFVVCTNSGAAKE